MIKKIRDFYSCNLPTLDSCHEWYQRRMPLIHQALDGFASYPDFTQSTMNHNSIFAVKIIDSNFVDPGEALS